MARKATVTIDEVMKKIREYKLLRKSFNRYKLALKKPEFEQFADVSCTMMLKTGRELSKMEWELCELLARYDKEVRKDKWATPEHIKLFFDRKPMQVMAEYEEIYMQSRR